VQGRRREITIGQYGGRAGEYSLADARAKTDEIIAIAKAGGDPTRRPEDEVAAVETLPSVPTFGNFAIEVVEAIEEGFRNPKHRKQWRSTLETYCANFSSKPVDEVTTDDVLACLTPIWTTKAVTASRVRGRIERVLDAAKAKKLRSGENPAAWHGHLSALLPRKNRSKVDHHAALAYDELPATWQKLTRLRSASARAMQFLILTAARSGEARGATWNEFDLGKGIWTVPGDRMKAGREHRVPLSPQATEIIKMMQQTQVSDYVFPGGKEDRPLTDMAMSMCLRDVAHGVTVHGFRSTFRDWVGEETEFPREVAEAALAHNVGDATERAYRRGDALERRRTLMEAWADFVTSILKAASETAQTG
jgi:integrase